MYFSSKHAQASPDITLSQCPVTTASGSCGYGVDIQWYTLRHIPRPDLPEKGCSEHHCRRSLHEAHCLTTLVHACLIFTSFDTCACMYSPVARGTDNWLWQENGSYTHKPELLCGNIEKRSPQGDPLQFAFAFSTTESPLVVCPSKRIVINIDL